MTVPARQPPTSLEPRLGVLLGCAAAVLVSGAGCRSPGPNHHPDRYARGIVFVLPGIEGRSPWNRDIALGLDEGGVASAIEVYDWTSGVPGDLVHNLANLERNLREAEALARRIREYMRAHPHSPVYLVGHSGGGGIAVLALEGLPEDSPVDQALLLAPALSAEYDLSTALRRTRHGIVSFHSPSDVALLKLGTSLFGPIDREFGPAAGAVGFRVPDGLADADRAVYARGLRQVRWTPRLKAAGADGSHLGWASRKFAREYLAPLLKRSEAGRPLPAESVE
jgi:pimeloyl-ACP methyl ester carboxylesterase